MLKMALSAIPIFSFAMKVVITSLPIPRQSFDCSTEFKAVQLKSWKVLVFVPYLNLLVYLWGFLVPDGQNSNFEYVWAA